MFIYNSNILALVEYLKPLLCKPYCKTFIYMYIAIVFTLRATFQ